MGTERNKSRTAQSILNDYVRKGNARSRNRVYIVHRLDRDTSGVLIFAKSEQANGTCRITGQRRKKKYLAVVYGRLTPTEGIISNYLAGEQRVHRYSTSDASKGNCPIPRTGHSRKRRVSACWKINLLTGQKAPDTRPLCRKKDIQSLAIKKYGKKGDGYQWLALHAQSIAFTHPPPVSGFLFETAVPEYLTRLIGNFRPVSSASMNALNKGPG